MGEKKTLRVRLRESEGHASGCLICGSPLQYDAVSRERTCALCGRAFSAPCACTEGHYVCDECHALGSRGAFLPLLLGSGERDPLKLFETVVGLPAVHLHGPEHHAIVPCVLLTAYRNCGGELPDLRAALGEALRRAGDLKGGSCGYLGVCGAAAGAGVYVSIVTGSTPLSGETWHIPQELAAQALKAVAGTGGPRCCKRSGRLAIAAAAKFTRERFGVDMPLGEVKCRHSALNRECIGAKCPYYPG